MARITMLNQNGTYLRFKEIDVGLVILLGFSASLNNRPRWLKSIYRERHQPNETGNKREL
jgi:hypothetical protein